MRRLLIIAALGLVSAAALAGPRFIPFEVSHGNTSTNILTQPQAVIGSIDEFYLAAPSRAGVTADVYMVVSPSIASGLANTELYTNSAATAALKARPRIPQTDSAGSNLSTNTVAERYFCVGGNVTFRIEQVSAVTGVVYKAWLKLGQ